MRTALLIIFAGSLLVYWLPPLPGETRPLIQAAWLLGVWLFLSLRILNLVAANTHLLLARLGVPTRRAPASYVRALFDDYAERFDEHLMVDLAYQAPNLVRSLVGQRLDGQTPMIVDLGCGTGICGPLFSSLGGTLIGVDLSQEMLQRAAQRGIYQQLHQADLLVFLRHHQAAFDLAIAADVLVYLGDLRPFFAACHAALKPGGYIVFTVESTPGEGWIIQRTGRYAHSRGYLYRLAEQYQLTPLEIRQAMLRTQRDTPVMGDAWLLQKPDDLSRFQDQRPQGG